MNIPTISEAARLELVRALKEAQQIADERQSSVVEIGGFWVSEALSALDSAHPAPKEGHAELKEFWLRSIPDGLSPSGRDQVATQIATMQIDLSEAKREVEALKAQFTPNGSLARENEAMRVEIQRLTTIADVHRETGISLAANCDSLRSHLKTANELLRSLLQEGAESSSTMT